MRTPLDSTIPFTRVDQQYFKVLQISATIWLVVCIVPTLALGYFFGMDGFPGVLWWLTSLIPLAIGIPALLFAKRRARAIGYFEDEDELIIHRGVMFESLTVVPYGRMQQVNVSTGPLLRRFDLVCIELVTASAASNASVPGLSRAEAERLRVKLTNLGSSQMEGL